MEIIFIRHGLTEWNEQKRIQGHTDIPLSKNGVKQVSQWQLPEDLQNLDYFSSPLVRTKQTASLLLGHENYLEDKNLIEMSWGKWEGMRVSSLRCDSSLDFAGQEAKGLDLQTPGGESPRDVRSRLQVFLDQRAAFENSSLVFTHKGNIRSALSLAFNWDMRSEAPVKLNWNHAHVFSLTTQGLKYANSISMICD